MTLRLPVTWENLCRLRRWGQNEWWAKTVKDAYLEMVKRKLYRPEAPSDGFGNIQLDDDALADPIRLEMEAWEAARTFYKADEKLLFEIHGCSDGRLAATMYLALQAAQLCCGGLVFGRIRKVLELAIERLPEGE